MPALHWFAVKCTSSVSGNVLRTSTLRTVDAMYACRWQVLKTG
jgi:hypothetical protein